MWACGSTDLHYAHARLKTSKGGICLIFGITGFCRDGLVSIEVMALKSSGHHVRFGVGGAWVVYRGFEGDGTSCDIYTSGQSLSRPAG